MTLRKIVESMRAKGVKVDYYVRKDGSIRITRINGAKYSPRRSEGNIALRAMAGQSLSERKKTQQTRQLSSIAAKRPKKASTYARRPRKTPLSKEIKAQIRRVQRLARKNATDKERYATVTTKTVRGHIEAMGEEKTLRHLKRLELHFRGLAYPEAILALADRLADMGNKTGSMRVLELSMKVRRAAYANVITETSLQAILAKCYDTERAINAGEGQDVQIAERFAASAEYILFN